MTQDFWEKTYNRDELNHGKNSSSFQETEKFPSFQHMTSTFQNMQNVPIPSYKVRTKYGYADTSDFKWKIPKDRQSLILRISKGQADSNALLSIMLLIFVSPFPSFLILKTLLPFQDSGSSFIEIFLYNLIGVSILSFLIRKVLTAIQPNWIVFQGDTLAIFQSLIYTQNPKRVKRIPISDINVCISNKTLGHDKKPIMTFGRNDTYLYLMYKDKSNYFQHDDDIKYIKLTTYDGTPNAKQSEEYLNSLLDIQKNNITNF